MPINEISNAFVDATATSIDLSSVFGVTESNSNPTYLVLTALDRNEYTAGASGATGSFTGNGHTATFTSQGGDARGVGIVFTYQPLTGLYYNSTYGYLNDLVYNSSSSLDDVTSLSLFGTSNLSLANAYASNAYDLMEYDAAGYLGSATIATEPSFTGSVPAQATPDSIAAVAETFVGKAWNLDGCWVLASTIAAEAGASLPAQSTLIGIDGQSNGEWIVAFDGPAGQTGNWQNMVTAGEIVVIGNAGGGGHITTVVSGSGSSAMLVDNITYVNQYNQILNGANDGSANDVIVAAPHPASQEWAGVQASSVVIYELDTPIVTASESADALAFAATQNLGPLFSATDPANNAITEWQVYDTATSDFLVYDSTDLSDHSAGTALTVGSLGAVALLAGNIATTDTLEVRAYNGSYWGDWTSLGVAIAATAPQAPVLATQTANQTWLGGQAFTLAIPGGAFNDPQSEALTYSAKLANGQALPSWLTFNPSTDTFSGTAPTGAQTLGIVVTATDTSGLAATDSFSATVIGTPTVTAQTAAQTWAPGSTVDLVLAANTFTDPQSQTLAYTATLSNGQPLPGWLSFNPANETFTGTAPNSATSLSIKVTATDTSGLSVSETFAASVAPVLTLAAPTPNQTWTDGHAVAFVLPAGTFTDAAGTRMTFAAYQTSGTSVTSWLRFNAAADEFVGNVPSKATGTIGLEVIATDNLHRTAVDTFSVTFAPNTGHVGAIVAPGSVGIALAPVLPQPGLLIPLHA
jgi:hypothetical protein